jgi:hypothetical protein
MATTVGRIVGIAVLPLTGDTNDAALHPGAELIAGRLTELLELRRSGPTWLVAALNTTAEDSTGGTGKNEHFPTLPDTTHTVAPEPDGTPKIPGWSGPSTDRPLDLPESHDHGPQVQIPARLEAAVDAARAGGKARRRTVVGAVVDVSASMRPWIVSGELADVLTAVQAVAGVSNRPSVAARFLPTDQEVEVALATDPADVLRSQLAANGLRTGDRSAMLAAVGRTARHGGLHLLVTDDASAAAEIGQAVVVLLGPNTGALDRTAPANLVAVPPGPVDVRRLARELADASADS